MSQATPITVGILLFGGESRRMGEPKWRLPFGAETMIERIARTMSAVIDTLILVGPADGELPALELSGVRVVMMRDRAPGLGPLEGLAVGLTQAAQTGAEFALAAACDTPLLQADFARWMLSIAPGFDAVVARDDHGQHPLPAVYSTRLAGALEKLFEAGERRAAALADLGNTRRVSLEEIRTIDPELLSLRNVNTPEEYAAALAAAGIG